MLNFHIIGLCIPLHYTHRLRLCMDSILLPPLDILPLPPHEFVDTDGKKKAEFVRELHAQVRANIEKKNEHYARQANKGRVKTVFHLGDWVWVHLRKERFAE